MYLFALQLTDSLDIKFFDRIAAVQTIRDAVQSHWESFTDSSTLAHCCQNFSTGEIDPNFGREVLSGIYSLTTLNSITHAVLSAQILVEEACLDGQGLSENPSKFVNDDVIAVMKNNLILYPSIKFQYVGTEEGVSTIYPRNVLCSSDYDPRFRYFEI